MLSVGFVQPVIEARAADGEQGPLIDQSAKFALRWSHMVGILGLGARFAMGSGPGRSFESIGGGAVSRSTWYLRRSSRTPSDRLCRNEGTNPASVSQSSGPSGRPLIAARAAFRGSDWERSPKCAAFRSRRVGLAER